MLEVPDSFVVEVVRQRGAQGREWLRGLPALIEELLAEWRLEASGSVRHGANAIVVDVEGAAQRCVLKVSWHTPTVAAESSALRVWNGHGAVQLLAADAVRGALLLERLDPTRTLRQLDLRTAAALAGSLIERLSVPAPPGLPTVASYGQQLADDLFERNRSLGGPVQDHWVDRAAGLARQLAADAGTTLVHADLHYGNVLAGSREPWLAIDPRAVAGDPEQSVPELMWTRIDELDDHAIPRLLDVIVEAGTLNADKAWAWTVVRAVDYWLWGLPIGLTIDPARCARLLTRLDPAPPS